MKKTKIIFYLLLIVFCVVLIIFVTPALRDLVSFPVVNIFAAALIALGLLQIYYTFKEGVGGWLSRSLYAGGAVAVSIFLFVYLHNIFYALSVIYEDSPTLFNIFNVLGIVLFIFSIIVSPILFIISSLIIIIIFAKRAK